MPASKQASNKKKPNAKLRRLNENKPTPKSQARVNDARAANPSHKNAAWAARQTRQTNKRERTPGYTANEA